MGKKVNKSVTIRQSELKALEKKITSQAINAAYVIYLTVMRDYEGWGKKRLRRLEAEIQDLSDSIARGYCSLYDLEKVLFDEARIAMKGGRFDKSDNN